MNVRDLIVALDGLTNKQKDAQVVFGDEWFVVSQVEPDDELEMVVLS